MPREVEARADAALIKGLIRRTVRRTSSTSGWLWSASARRCRGLFLSWIEAEFEMSQRSAYNFISVAEKFGDKVATVASLTPRALYELAASTAEVQAEVERRVAAGEIVSDGTA